MERSRYLLIFAFAALTACGGGSGGGSSGGGENGGETEGTNAAPTAAAGSDRSEYAGTTVELAGSGDDSDGSVASYSWKQTGGPDVSLTNADSDTASFEAPDVDASAELNFEITVTDNDGAQATDSVVITVVPAFEMSGRVYDGPIANAEITVDVGGTLFQTTADTHGTFSLLVGSPDPDALVVLYANGPTGSEHISLMGVGPSFATLKTLAGDDNLLEETESWSVNITNITSAIAALMVAENDGALPASQTELETLELQVSGEALLRFATAIKLVVDGGYDLPTDADDTMELVSDHAFVNAFLDAVALIDANAYDVTEAEMLADKMLFPSFKNENIASVYNLFLVNSFEISGHSDYNLLARGVEMNLDTGGTGSLYSYEPQASFTWTLVDGEIVIDYDASTGLEKTCTVTFDDISWQQVACETHPVHGRMQMIAAGVDSDVFLVNTTYETSYPDNPELDPVVSESSYVYSAVADADLALGLTVEDVVGSWAFQRAILDHYDPTSRAETAILDFASNGTGSSRATDYAEAAAFNWELSTEGDLVIDFVDGYILTVKGYRREGIIHDVVQEFVTGAQHDVRYVLVDPIVKLEEDFAFSTDPVNFAGSYQMFDEYPYFTLVLAEDGTGYDHGYIDGEPTSNDPTAWSLLEDGRLRNSKASLMTGERVDSCDGQVDCYDLQRLWTPVAYDESLDRLFILEERRTVLTDEFGAATETPGFLVLKFWGKHETQ